MIVETEGIMADTPWLDVMRSRLGTQEMEGDKDNPVIIGWFKAVGHGEVVDDSTAWCAITVGSALVECGLPIPPTNVNMMARSFLNYGVACEPQPGAIAIWPRGTGWQGHVNVVETVTADGKVVCIGGNQSGKAGGDAVTRTKPQDPSKALGFRMPVPATVPALRKAGSTEIKKADRIQNLGIFATLVGPVVAWFKDTLAPVWDGVSAVVAPMLAMPSFGNVNEGLSFWQTLLGGANAVGKVVLDNPWLAGSLGLGLGAYWVGNSIKAARVAKAAAGVPLSNQIPTAEAA